MRKKHSTALPIAVERLNFLTQQRKTNTIGMKRKGVASAMAADRYTGLTPSPLTMQWNEKNDPPALTAAS